MPPDIVYVKQRESEGDDTNIFGGSHHHYRMPGPSTHRKLDEMYQEAILTQGRRHGNIHRLDYDPTYPQYMVPMQEPLRVALEGEIGHGHGHHGGGWGRGGGYYPYIYPYQPYTVVVDETEEEKKKRLGISGTQVGNRIIWNGVTNEVYREALYYQ